MRKGVKYLIENNLLDVIDEDVDLLDEYESACGLEDQSTFDAILYYDVLKWMKKNRLLREQVKFRLEEQKRAV